MSILKRICLLLLLLVLTGCFAPALAMESTVLTETELSVWIDQTLRDSAVQTPSNAPVGEESLTEQGYAFLYDFATLYYNKANLDAASVLQAVSLTDEAYPAVRGLCIGDSQDQLMEALGAQNPFLLGDGTFAVLYQQDLLPGAAYWSWAQHDENHQLTGVQCAVHVRAGEDRYTDAGIRFVLENGVITEIRVYGLHDFVTLADVQANLDAVRAVENAIGGWALAEENREGYTVFSDAAEFSAADLLFSGVDFRSLQAQQLENVLGQIANQSLISSENEQIVIAEWEDVYLSGGAWADVLSVTSDRLSGPRGISAGDTLDSVLSLFASDGEGRIYGTQSILYGDGLNAPCGVLERDGELATVCYTTQMEREGQWLNGTLMLTFADDVLEEWMIYTW